MVRVLKRELDSWMFSRPGERFCAYFNVVNGAYWKYPIMLVWDPDRRKIRVDENGRHLFIARPRRAKRYNRGIGAKLESLASEYLLRRIEFHDGDCIVDCGANVGEVGMWLKDIGRNLEVISIEPEEAEAECCDLNVYGGNRETIRKALWRQEGALTLFSKNDSGDSSLFETTDYVSSCTVPTTTLSSLMHLRGISRVKLLKLEAEGAEPEILAGGVDDLDRIEYISADLGPERGIQQESTAAPAINFLLSHNFRLVDVFADRFVCLFKNEKLH